MVTETTIETAPFSYGEEPLEFKGVITRPASAESRRPAVMVVHAFGGLGPFEIEQAKSLARLGYLGVCIDLYGNGRRAGSREEASSLMRALNGDRPELRRHLLLALDAVRALPDVDRDRVGAIGFCFGGKAVLDLARSGAKLSGVVSFHGVYDPPGLPLVSMNTPVLACMAGTTRSRPPTPSSRWARNSAPHAATGRLSLSATHHTPSQIPPPTYQPRECSISRSRARELSAIWRTSSGRPSEDWNGIIKEEFERMYALRRLSLPALPGERFQ